MTCTFESCALRQKFRNYNLDDKTWMGSLSELRVASELTSGEFHVFSQTSGKAPFDLVTYKNDKLLRINIKSTKTKADSGNYKIEIGSVRSNRTVNVVHKFDKSKSDILAIYIQPEDKIIYFDTQCIESGRCLTIQPEHYEQDLDWLIKNYS